MKTQDKNKMMRINRKGGFSLIELIVAVSIMIIITSIVVFKQSKFSSDVLITNLAYEVALAVREAQAFGISSKASPGEANFRVGYGIYLSGGSSGEKMTSYTEFIDNPEIGVGNTDPGSDELPFNFIYTGTDTPIDDIQIGQGQSIRSYCALKAGFSGSDINNWVCWTAGGSTDFALSIVFVKPDPDAHITDQLGGQYSEVDIEVESALGDKCRTVNVTSVGQISIKPIPDPSLPSCN